MASLLGVETSEFEEPEDLVYAITDVADRAQGQVKSLKEYANELEEQRGACLLYTSPSPRDVEESRMPSSA